MISFLITYLPFLLVLIVSALCLVLVLDINKIKNKGLLRLSRLNAFLSFQLLKNKRLSQNIILSEHIEKVLFKRFLKINTEILSLQKIIFEL
ncbi:hypothetical protein GCM10023330_21840 [Litoribaculum gwangyangense]|uniref:ATP synthase F0 subunit 8 n=1 Tax=Litoribaculum gwangyangense TaxID=1130722 RepID=A0ABP9CMH6_9FLAO